MKKARFNPLSSEVRSEIDALAALPEDQINTDDIPEVRDWSNARRRVLFELLLTRVC